MQEINKDVKKAYARKSGMCLKLRCAYTSYVSSILGKKFFSWKAVLASSGHLGF
jgi:hypothetical protein